MIRDQTPMPADLAPASKLPDSTVICPGVICLGTTISVTIVTPIDGTGVAKGVTRDESDDSIKVCQLIDGAINCADGTGGAGGKMEAGFPFDAFGVIRL